jgi:WD40 repeat protein
VNVTAYPITTGLAAANRPVAVALRVATAFIPRQMHYWVVNVKFSPDGSRLASASDNGMVRVWDMATGRETHTLQGDTKAVTSVAFRPDGTCLVSGGWDSTVRVWDVGTGREVITLRGHRGDVRSVAFSPNGSRLASGDQWASPGHRAG